MIGNINNRPTYVFVDFWGFQKPLNVVSFISNSRLFIIQSRSYKMFPPSSSPSELKFFDFLATNLAGLALVVLIFITKHL
jgi:hypothetical protein